MYAWLQSPQSSTRYSADVQHRWEQAGVHLNERSEVELWDVCHSVLCQL
jgi:hypothetical protein